MALSIGQVATAADVNIQTIRYYERRGLFPAAKRTPAGYRQYAADAVARLRFIKHAQDLGFSLNEIEELLGLRVRHVLVPQHIRRTRLVVDRGLHPAPPSRLPASWPAQQSDCARERPSTPGSSATR